jgi:hypothetical protein
LNPHVEASILAEETGNLWIRTAKEARKCAYIQTAYSSILQAMSLNPVVARIEHSKWLWAQQQKYEAQSELRSITHRDLKTFVRLKPSNFASLPAGTKIEAKVGLN